MGDGGVIGLELAMSYPDRVTQLVVIGTNYRFDGLTELYRSMEEDYFITSKDYSTIRWFYRSIAPNPDYWPTLVKKVLKMWRSQPNYSIDQLAQISAPTLVMVGDNDAIKLEHTQVMSRTIPDTEMIIIPDASHMVPVEKPDFCECNDDEILESQIGIIAIHY